MAAYDGERAQADGQEEEDEYDEAFGNIDEEELAALDEMELD